MTTTPSTGNTATIDAADQDPPQSDKVEKTSPKPPPTPPPAALRTYMMLRLSMIGVLLALAISVVLEVGHASGCWQPSISAYYYTPTRAVFVAALVTLGTCMIVLWGQDKWEDGFLNIAGMLAPVVAFVPTSDANYCSVVTSTGKDLTESAEKSDAAAVKAQGTVDTIVAATHDAIDNNVRALGGVIALSLIALLVLALIKSDFIPRADTNKAWRSDPSFYVPWLIALVVLAIGTFLYTAKTTWFYDNAHGWSATTMFGFIIIVVLTNVRIQRSAYKHPEMYPWEKPKEHEAHRRWAMGYSTVAAVMVLTALGIWLTRDADKGSWYSDHWVLLIEATLIGLFAIFWVMQTIDRHKDGAPREQEPSQPPPG